MTSYKNLRLHPPTPLRQLSSASKHTHPPYLTSDIVFQNPYLKRCKACIVKNSHKFDCYLHRFSNLIFQHSCNTLLGSNGAGKYFNNNKFNLLLPFKEKLNNDCLTKTI